MRKMSGTTAILILLSTLISAQTSVSRTYIKGGKDAFANFLKEIYLNPSFESGLVEYKNGKTYKSTLNYNRALGAIQFIDEKGDTLALNNDDHSVKSVSIGESVFYMEPVCIEKIAGNDRIMLGKNERAKQTDKQKVGALGIPNNAGTIDSYDRSYSRNNHFIDINEELLIRKTTTYYVTDREGNFVPASKKNILGIFPKSQKDINRFIQEKATDFSVEADLIELTEYLTTL
jgi:hypothetical protein